MPVCLPPSWEAERYRRGQQRMYVFDTLPPSGLASAGSTSALAPPNMSMTTGSATLTPQNRGREATERKSGIIDTWTGSDQKNYWGRRHHMYSWMGVGAGNITPIGGRLWAGIFLQSPVTGASGLPANPNNPVVLLRYVRNGNLEIADERYELITAVGNGTPYTITRLTGVPNPRSDFTGNPYAQRLELFYNPGVAVYASIDGVLGAVSSATLPDVTRVPIVGNFMAGWGVYLDACNIGDNAQAAFYSSVIETHRP